MVLERIKDSDYNTTSKIQLNHLLIFINVISLLDDFRIFKKKHSFYLNKSYIFY